MHARIPPQEIWWSENGELVTIGSDQSFYILRYNRELVDNYLASGEPVDENEGIEDAFELLYEIGERVRTGVWMGDCFIYNNSEWRLNYCVGGEVTTIFHLDRPMYILGYMASQNRLYLIDREFSVVRMMTTDNIPSFAHKLLLRLVHNQVVRRALERRFDGIAFHRTKEICAR